LCFGSSGTRLVVIGGVFGIALTWPRAAVQTQGPTLRAGSALIVIDAQVVDGKVAPVVGPTAKDFGVAIAGREHRVAAGGLGQESVPRQRPLQDGDWGHF
jgi:hypothetical protein